jgi:hypothetical protein
MYSQLRKKLKNRNQPGRRMRRLAMILKRTSNIQDGILWAGFIWLTIGGFGFYKEWRTSGVAEWLLASHEGLCSMELVQAVSCEHDIRRRRISLLAEQLLAFQEGLWSNVMTLLLTVSRTFKSVLITRHCIGGYIKVDEMGVSCSINIGNKHIQDDVPET